MWSLIVFLEHGEGEEEVWVLCYKGRNQGNMWSKGHWGHRPPDDVPQKQITSSPGQVRSLRVSERMDRAPPSLLQVFPGLQWIRGSQNLQSRLEVTRKSQRVQVIPERREVEIGQSITGDRDWRKTSSGMCPAGFRWINEMVTCVELGTRVNHGEASSQQACISQSGPFPQSGPWHGAVQGCLPAQIRASCLIVFILSLEMMLNKNQTEPPSPTFL